MKVVLLCVAVVVLFPACVMSKDTEWDVLIFSQEWPITSCISHMEHKPGAACNLFPNMTSWTVHGIWPTKLGTIGPNYCNKSWHFNETQILDIEPYLIKYWPNIYAEESRTSLWKHEWVKHGTCAAQLPQLDGERKYFQQGLNWVMQYDIVAVLTKSKIIPSKEATHSNHNIFQAVNDAFGVDPAIDCIYDKKTKRHLLSQIKLCFDRSLKLVDCDGIIGRRISKLGNCPTEGIIYPANIKTGGKSYTYSQKLALTHTQAWDKTNSCSSWVCRAFIYLNYLTWISL